MIVPMKKMCLMVQDKYRKDALVKLRETGVMHVELSDTASDSLARVLERKARVESAMSLILPYKAAERKKAGQGPGGGRERRRDTGPRRGRRTSDKMGVEALEPYSLDAVNAPVRPELVDLLLGMGSERKALEEQEIFLDKEAGRLSAWGDFDPGKVKELSALGLPLYLYVISQEVFKSMPDEISYIKIGEDKDALRLAVLYTEIPNIQPLPLPHKSLSQIAAELSETRNKLAALNERIKSFADRRPVLMKELAEIQHDVKFEEVMANLEKVEGVAPEFGFSYITGFIPAEDLYRLKTAAAENNWALAADDPGPDDNVPTKLKNSRFARLLNPLTDFLEVVPGYHEVDVSGWFLFFFVVYFGMIFGDAAYGAIILTASIAGILKTMKKKVPPVLKLMLLLGMSNFVWGVLTCTWFGVEAGKLPLLLQNISFSPISNLTAAQSARGEAIVRQNLMIFCFSLALLQLSIGHIIAITHCRTLKILGDLGSIAMLAGMFGIVLALIASNEYRQIPLLMPCVYALGGGFVINFVFSNYEGSIGKSIVESLKNFISMVLGIANVFSDIMSYIRLWAVGLAGAAISSTVVAMAGPMLGHFFLFIFGVILLVFGHGLNLVLNALSVLVHGVRLNTLEFSSHAGLTWAGRAYKPFAEKGG